MRKHRSTAGVTLTAMLAAALTSLVLAGGASAKLTGEFTKFQHCPWKDATVTRCIHSETTGGTVVLGNKTTTIEKPVVLQGGYKAPVSKISEFVAATNGITLSKAPQKVPGGLLGIVPPEKSSWLVKRLSAFFFENGLTGVNSTVELAQPASNIRISEQNLAQKVGVALKMPVRVRLENPFLGGNCYVGSSGSPIVWELTSGITPDGKMTGSSGKVQFLEQGRVLGLNGTELVGNNWSAPKASGCGGILSFLVNPIINSQVGLPASAGKNSALLKNTIRISTPAAVKANDEANP